MWLARLVILVLGMVSIVLSQDDFYPVSEKRESTAYYCGGHLSDVLHLVCGGYYNSMFKKSAQGEQIAKYTLGYVLHLVCGGYYNSMFKKSAQVGGDRDRDRDDWLKDLEAELDMESSIEDMVAQYPFRSRSQARALMAPHGSFRRHTRGAFDECCKKPCSIKEIRGYCQSQ